MFKVFQSQINDVETEVDNTDLSSTNFHPPGNIVDVESPEGNHDNDSDENTEEMDQDKLQKTSDGLYYGAKSPAKKKLKRKHSLVDSIAANKPSAK